MDDLHEVLANRDSRYGGFSNVAKTARSFKASAAVNENHYKRTSAEEKEALDMIFHKLARILCQQGYDGDSWLDVAGYALLAHEAAIKRAKEEE